MQQHRRAQASCSSGHACSFMLFLILAPLVMKSLLTLRRTRDALAGAPNLTFSCLKGRPQELPVYSPPSKSGRLRRGFLFAEGPRPLSAFARVSPIRTPRKAPPRHFAGPGWWGENSRTRFVTCEL